MAKNMSYMMEEFIQSMTPPVASNSLDQFTDILLALFLAFSIILLVVDTINNNHE
jgi:preprotein translocase subunit SecG